MKEYTRWLVVEDRNGDWVIDCEPGRATPGRIICTFQSYTEAQAYLAEYAAQLWGDRPAPF